MIWLLLVPVVIWFILLLKKRFSFTFSQPPKSLELKPMKGLKKLSDELEQSLSKSYMENVEARVRKENTLKENEYEWRLLELKRYFILTSLLKEAPMFSNKVDELWHQMLMFTREYDEFSMKYLGTTLHHRPNVKEESDPDLRGFFDWVYAELFSIRRENLHLYKGFFKNPVNPIRIEKFRTLPEEELINRYFKSDSKYMNTVRALVDSMKKSANMLKDYEKRVLQENMSRSRRREEYNLMLVPFLSVSYYHYGEFYSYMAKSSDHSSNVYCGSASSCSSCTSDSSCSSCGGGGD